MRTGERREAGFDAATSGSSESSVLRSPANVRVEWFSAGGSSDSACSSAVLWLAMAAVVALVFATSWVSSWLREPSVCSALAPWTSRPSNAGSSRVSSWVTLLVLSSAGAKYRSV